MATTLADARETVRYGRTGARFLDTVEPGQRCIKLTRNQYGHYIPELAEVVGVTPSGRVTVLTGLIGTKKITTGIESLFTEPGQWCEGGIYCSVTGHNGTHHDGEVSVDRRVFVRRYPLKSEPTREQVLADWRAAPETFTEGWCRHK